MGSAMLELFRKFIKEHVTIETRHTEGRIEILIKLDGETVSSDFIDYTDVVRIANRQNDEVFH